MDHEMPTMAHGSPLHETLRDKTRAAHRAIDHHPLLSPLVQKTLTRPHYQHVLTALEWVHRQVEPALRQAAMQWWGPTGFMPSPRLDWLRHDLSCVGTPIDWQAPPPSPFPPPSSPAETIGTLYVVEGSTLGGRVIARQVAASLGLDAGHGAAYFNGHGDTTQTRWIEFWSFAESACAVEDAETAANAALRLFGWLKCRFDEVVADTAPSP